MWTKSYYWTTVLKKLNPISHENLNLNILVISELQVQIKSKTNWMLYGSHFSSTVRGTKAWKYQKIGSTIKQL